MDSNELIRFGSLPVGYRFHPTDEELIKHYLHYKKSGNEFAVQLIREVDILKHEPWELPKLSVITSDDQEWFFFWPRESKSSNGSRSNRATEAGYWKITGRDGKVESRDGKKVIGTKKFLVFYIGRVPNAIKTNWVIHEYHSAANFPSQRNYVLCRLIQKPDKKNGVSLSTRDSEPNGYVASDFENIAAEDTTPEAYINPQTNEDLFFQPAPQPIDDFSLRSPLYTELECTFNGLSSANGYRGDVNGVQSQFGFPEDEVNVSEFLDSIIVDGDEYFQEETSNAFLNDVNQPESFTMVYQLQGAGFSSDTDNEATLAQYNHVLGTSNLFNEVTARSSIGQEMRLIKDSRGSPHSSKHFQYKEDTNVHQINCIFSLGDDDSSQESRTRPVVQGGSPRRIRSKSKIQRKATSQDMAKEDAEYSTALVLSKKETSTVESKKELKFVKGKKAAKVSKTTYYSSAESDRKSVSVNMETKCIKYGSSPPSCYAFNTVLGGVLFVVVLRELLLYGQWS